MMREVFQRRFARALEEDPERTKGEWPDLVLIDGGKGQVSAVSAVFAELGIDDLPYVGVAKGPDRNAGRETFYLPDGREFTLPPRSEEHTSELQSLMRISYAVFFLKKKTTQS